MPSYQQQLEEYKSSKDSNYSRHIWKNDDWTIKDYEELFEDIERGYIIQGDFDTHSNGFIINPNWEE